MSTSPRNIFLDINHDLNLIDPVMRPEEVRSGDPITCEVFSGGKSKKVQIWSYCPFGFEFIDSDSTSFCVGETHPFKITLGKASIETNGSIVFKKQHNGKENLFGVRINYNIQSTRTLNEERRLKNRWLCPEHLLPTGTAPNPTRYNDFIFFKIVDISSNGVKIATSLRNKLLSIGQILECTISVPMIGTFCAPVKINRVGIETIQEKEQLILGVSFIKKDDIVLSTLSEYLLTFAEECSVKSLKDAGFNATLNPSKFDFSYSKSATDYSEVLDLRFEAYKDSGKLTENVTKEFMQDEFDSRSRILTVKMNNKLVGSARAMFHQDNDKTSHERYLTYPKNFPKISECLEVSRVCVKPDFQGTGLAKELVKHLALLTIKANRKFIYLSAAPELVDFWLKLGFTDTGVTYFHKQLGNLEHRLLINNIEDSILARKINASDWIEAYEHLYNYCVEYGFIEPTLMDQIKIAGFKTFKKVF